MDEKCKRTKSSLDKKLDAWRKKAKRRMRNKWTYKILKGGCIQRPSFEERLEGALSRKKNRDKKKTTFRRSKDSWAGTKVSCSLWTVKKR